MKATLSARTEHSKPEERLELEWTEARAWEAIAEDGIKGLPDLINGDIAEAYQMGRRDERADYEEMLGLKEYREHLKGRIWIKQTNLAGQQ